MLKLDSKSRYVLKNIKYHSGKARKGATDGLWFAGKFLQKATRTEISNKRKKTGRYYLYKNKLVRASAPGEYPANRSGKLRDAVNFNIINSKTMLFGVRDNISYGGFLELGTSKMRKRPYIDKTVNNNYQKITNIIGQEIKKRIIAK